VILLFFNEEDTVLQMVELEMHR